MTRLRYPIVLFDAGETLIAPRESFGAVYARVLGTLGVVLPADDIEQGLRRCWAETNRAIEPGVDRYRMNGDGEQAYWFRFVTGTLAHTPGAPRDDAFAARALTPLREAFRDPAAWQVYDDVIPVLASLRDDGARLAIVSNWDSGLPSLLERLGLAGWFDAVVVSHLEGMEKPRPELFLRAVMRVGGTPGEALHVGDVPELDGAGAEAAGIASVIIDRRGRSGAAVPGLSGVPRIARDGREAIPSARRSSG